MIDLPRVGSPMYVVHAEGVSYRSRLEGVDADTFSLTPPLETAGPAVPRAGQLLDVYWAHTRTRVNLPCRLVGIAETAPYQWILEAAGAPVQSNRREFVRGGGGGAVRLVVEAEESDEAVVGRLLDISEGGLRCWVAKAPQVGTGARMQVSMPLGRAEVELIGAVLDVRDAFDGPGQHMILTYQTSEYEAQLIRQHVYAWEIAERRQYQDF